MRRLAEGIFVSGQIRPEMAAEAAHMGVRRIINNRPDGEEPGQPTSSEIEAAARAAGLDYVHLPVWGRPDLDTATRTAALLAETTPTLAFCRSGMRSTAAWAMARTGSGDLTADEARAAALEAGYDLSGLPL